MAYREMELTLLSAQELKNVNLITRMDVYAVVSISGDPLTRQCTEPDLYGGRNPCWNETFRFAVPPTASAAAAAGAFLHVLLRAERFLGDRDVGEAVVPLADILSAAATAGPLPPHVASYQVRKLHRWEPRGVLSVSYRLGPVVAPVAAVVQPPAPDPEKAAANFNAAYAPVAVTQQPSYHHQHPSAVAYPPPPPPEQGRRPAARVADAEHDEAAAQRSPVMGVPQKQASHPLAKPDSYRPPTPPRPAAVHAARPASPAARNGFGQPGPTHVYMGPQTQIIFSGGLPTRTVVYPAGSGSGSISSPARGKGAANWAFLQPGIQGNYDASAASVAESISSWRPGVLSPFQSQQDTQQQQQQEAASSPVALAPSHHSLLAASPFFSRSSSFSSPHHPSTATSSPSPLRRSPNIGSTATAEVAGGTNNNTFRSVSSPSPPSSSPLIPKSAISSPFPPSSSPLVSRHSNVVPSL